MPHLLNLSPSLTRTINLEMMHMAVHHFRRRISKIRQTSCPSRIRPPLRFRPGWLDFMSVFLVDANIPRQHQVPTSGTRYRIRFWWEARYSRCRRSKFSNDTRRISSTGANLTAYSHSSISNLCSLRRILLKVSDHYVDQKSWPILGIYLGIKKIPPCQSPKWVFVNCAQG